MAYERPHGTTANPNWQFAESPTDLIPSTDDPTGVGAEITGFIGKTIITQGQYAGRRLEEVMLPWQEAVLLYSFGQMDRNQRRAVKKVLLKIGKGSGKTMLLAAIALGFTMWSAAQGKHTRALVAIVAAGISSADLAFRHVEEAVLADPHLEGVFVSSVQRRSIKHVESGIEIQVLPPKRDSAVGRRPVLLLVDELHEAAQSPDFSAVLDQLQRGGANWPDFLQVTITTSPIQEAKGAYSHALQDARRVRDGEVANESLLPVLFEWPTEREDLSVEESSEWWRGLPSLDATLPLEAIQHEYEEAVSASSNEPMALFLSQRLGLEPDDRKAVDGLLLQDRWPELPEAGEVPTGQPLWLAYDPSSGVDDPSAMLIMWKDGDKTCAHAEQHLAQVGYDRASQNLKDLYDKAIDAGELTVHPTAEVMDSKIIARTKALSKDADYSVIIGGDLHGRAGFPSRMRNETEEEYHKVSQGWQLQAALSDCEAMAADGVLAHNHQPLLTANILNLTVEDGPSGRRFSKRGAGASGQGEAKIDGSMAMLSGITLMAEHQNEGFDVSHWIG